MDLSPPPPLPAHVTAQPETKRRKSLLRDAVQPRLLTPSGTNGNPDFFTPPQCLSAACALLTHQQHSSLAAFNMQWPQLFLCLALALSLQPALALLSPKGCLSRSSQRQQPSHRLARHCRSSSSGSLRARPTRRIPLALAAQQQPQHRRHQHHPCTLAQSTTAAAAASLGSFSCSDVSQRRRSARQRAAWSSTALALAAGRGVPGEAGDGAEGGQGKDGWRQRMVRTIVSVFLRMRAVVAAVGARLRLGGSSKVGGTDDLACLLRTPVAEYNVQGERLLYDSLRSCVKQAQR